jgi:hypothetical protein
MGPRYRYLVLALLPLVLGFAPAAPPAPAEVTAALEHAATVAAAKVMPFDYRPVVPRGCTIASAEVRRPLTASGRVAGFLRGRDNAERACEGWAWVKVRLFAQALVTTRSIREGEPIDRATFTVVTREILPGRVPAQSIPPGAVAARPLGAKQLIEIPDLRAPQAKPGSSIKVAIRSGVLTIEQTGRAVPCSRNRSCALLPSGRRVEGELVGDRIVVEVP